MCDMLQNNVNLLKIDLSNNGFTDRDTGYLLDALKVMQGWKTNPLLTNKTIQQQQQLNVIQKRKL